MQIKRVCIVTNYSNTTNYGALLQAYALNRVVNDMGYLAEDLYYVQDSNNKREKLIKQIITGDFHSIANQIKSRLGRIKVKTQLNNRKTIMDEFRLSIPHTRKCNDSELKKIINEFDVFICGSDQIFRPNRNTGKLEPHYWLDMVGNTCIKASYAASMGIEKYEKTVEDQAREYLKSFDYISIREASAVNYVKRITGRNDIITSIDPVFLLNSTEWIQISAPYDVEGKYILVYMIHGTESLYQSIKRFAELKDLKIISFPSMSYRYKSFEKTFGDIKVSDASPNQFIYLIENAEYIFTDSFHGTAFSLILHKASFVSRANEIAFSRIEDILYKTGAETMIIPSDGLSVELYDKKPEIDWSRVDSVIEKEQKASYKYLNDVIEL